MKLEHTDIIDAPLETVYSIVRDELSKVAEYLPNIREIKVLSSQEKSGKLHVVNQWFAEANVPSLVKKFIREELFSWKDTAEWDNKNHKVNYQLESFFAKDIYEAKGTNYFKAKDDKTVLTLTCEINIYPEKIPGIPRLLAGKIRPVVEQMIEKMLAPNLTSLGEGIRNYLKAQS
ncbi:MAG: SRPBCC family protein [Deltaproteobacteria bacterium]|nr:SRPBCC family protein [Deltaproteobacteria bacterium]